jgi:hypothetical protein
MRHVTPEEIRSLLISRRSLDRAGCSSRSIQVALESDRLHRVRRGWYLPRDTWDALWPESQHLTEVIAMALATRGSDPVFSHASAAVLWGLPLYRVKPRRVHVVSDRAHPRHSIPGIMRHESPVPPADVAEIGGVLCTSLSRTVYDTTRVLGDEAGLALMDAAIARIGGDPWEFDDDAAETWTGELDRRLRIPGARGVVRARRVAELADGRAQLPLESVTRYRLHQLGFPRARLQTPVPRADEGFYWLDIAIEGARTFIECDGKEKYLDPELRAGRSIEQVLLDEKAREDWIRGTTGWRIVRVGSDDMRTLESAEAKFRGFGLLRSR